MRTLQIVLCIIGLIFLSTQTFRHVYVKWVQSTDSALDLYDDKTDRDIKVSKSIEELVSQYDKAYKSVKEYENDTNNPKLKWRERERTEPYKSEIKLKKAIEKWEYHQLQIQKLRFYWFCGFFSICLGFFVYVKIDQWLGMIALITGFSEMIFWTFPVVFGFFGSKYEFENLLNNKIIFSILSWVLLIAVWVLMHKFKGKQRN